MVLGFSYFTISRQVKFQHFLFALRIFIHLTFF
nr:MAG TPA: hypothetical protein [Caudoviricetes sp.]